MGILFAFLLAGIMIGRLHLLPQKILALAGRGMTLGVIFLLLTMGLRIGVNRETLSQLGNYGFQVFIYALFCIFGSLITVSLLENGFTESVESAIP